MENKKVVIALGGNALEEKGKPSTAENQLSVVKKTAEKLAKISAAGYEIAIVHGNGPQVGRILLASETAHNVTPRMPFDVCGAMSQGYIGYHLQNSIANELAARGIQKTVGTLVTQVLVDEADPAFQKPSKPVGAFYDKETADKIAAERGYTMVEDAGRGWRQVVPSPKPVDVVEKDMVNTLVDSGYVVITVGGGGIPVVKKDGRLVGTPAVIDKDFASAKLAELIDADMLVILTAVDRVAINWGKPDQKALAEMTVDEAEKYCGEGHFAPGSMLPKVQAAMSFAKAGGTAIIASLENAAAALRGESGTRIVK